MLSHSLARAKLTALCEQNMKKKEENKQTFLMVGHG